MNIEQYRALKAQAAEASQKADQTQEADKGVEETTQNPTTPPATKTTSTETTDNKQTETTEEVKEKTKEEKQDKINIDGVGEVTLDELKNGYLRTADYTKKTQEVSRKSKDAEEAIALYNHLKQNPQLAQQLLQTEKLPATLDPAANKISELENKMYDMMLQQEISTLQNKYPDFEIKDVLETAQEKKIVNLEDAYHLVKSRKPAKTETIDKEALKKELRQELLKEIEAEKSTSSIITTSDSGAVVEDNTPKITEAERKVARHQKLTDEEYIKWRDVGKKRK